MTTDILSNIKASAAGKSPAQIAQLRKDIAADIAGLAPHLKGTEILQRFGQGQPHDPQSAEQQAARIERHRAEIEYLDRLLADMDPILAAQATVPAT